MLGRVSGIYSGRVSRVFVSNSLRLPLWKIKKSSRCRIERTTFFFKFTWRGDLWFLMAPTCHLTSATPSHTDWLWWSWTDSRPAACQSAERQKNRRVEDLFIHQTPNVHAVTCKNLKSYLWERNPKRHSCDNGHVGLHERSDQLKAALEHRGQVSPQSVRGHVIWANQRQEGYVGTYLRQVLVYGEGRDLKRHVRMSDVNIATF